MVIGRLKTVNSWRCHNDAIPSCHNDSHRTASRGSQLHKDCAWF